MRTIKPLNNAELMRIGRKGDTVTIEITFSDKCTKTAAVSAAALAGLGKDESLRTGMLSVRRRSYKQPSKARAIDMFFIQIAGEGPDLALVSRAELLRAAGIKR